MHWGQIKALLILSFFILDIYLLAQFLEKKELSDIAIWEEQSATIEEQLRSEDITFNELPEEEYEESFISVKQHYFDEKDLKDNKSLVKQDPFIFDNYLIVSKLDKPIYIKENLSKDSMEEKLTDIVSEPDNYSYWNWNKDLNIIIYFQNKERRPVYFNQNGLVLLFLNDKNEVEYYSQTMLGEAETLDEKQKLITPMHAIEKLYNSNELYAGDNIEDVNIGFHTRVPSESGVQVFAPIWKVNVNNEQNYFVNAIEGFTFSTEEEDFLSEAIETNIDRLQVTRKKDSPISDIIDDLKEREELLEEDGED